MANWFVALPIAPYAWFARVPDPPEGTRRFHRDDLHITVAFLGPVGEAEARAAFAEAHGWPVGAVEASLGRVRAMGSKRHFSALSAELELGREPVACGIAAVRDRMCDAACVRRDQRPALPHVTLARPGRSATSEQREGALAWASALELGEPRVLIDRIALYTWADDRRLRMFKCVGEVLFR